MLVQIDKYEPFVKNMSTTKAYRTITKAVDKIIAYSKKENTKSHSRNKSLFHQDCLSSSLTTEDTKEMP